MARQGFLELVFKKSQADYRHQEASSFMCLEGKTVQLLMQKAGRAQY